MRTLRAVGFLPRNNCRSASRGSSPCGESSVVFQCTNHISCFVARRSLGTTCHLGELFFVQGPLREVIVLVGGKAVSFRVLIVFELVRRAHCTVEKAVRGGWDGVASEW